MRLREGLLAQTVECDCQAGRRWPASQMPALDDDESTVTQADGANG